MVGFKEPHIDLAQRYFSYLAKRFPVMCASDEFPFLPRAEEASQYYNRLDNFEAGSINESTMALKEFQNKFNQLTGCNNDLEKLIDRFQLNSGYQLCYILGSYEIKRLKEAFSNRIGRV